MTSGRPRTEVGYMASRTSSDQISISGSRLPTAIKFPKPDLLSVGLREGEEVEGGKSSHSRQRGKLGSMRSWCT